MIGINVVWPEKGVSMDVNPMAEQGKQSGFPVRSSEKIRINVGGRPKQEVTCASWQWRVSCQKQQNVSGAILFALAKWHQICAQWHQFWWHMSSTACQAVKCPGRAQSCEAFDATGHRMAYVIDQSWQVAWAIDQASHCQMTDPLKWQTWAPRLHMLQ